MPPVQRDIGVMLLKRVVVWSLVLLAVQGGVAHAYVGDYESTYWRAWLKVGDGDARAAAKSSKVSLQHMDKRYRIVGEQMATFTEMAKTGSPEERATAEQEVAFLGKRLEWMKTRKDGNEWIIAEAEKENYGALPFIADDVAVTLELAHQATLRQVRAAQYDQLRRDFDAADKHHIEGLKLWDRAANETRARLAALEAEIGEGDPTVEQQARLDYLREWSQRFDETAAGLHSEYEAMLDPQVLVNRGLFYSQREQLYESISDSQFRGVYRDRVEFFFEKALWRCEELTDRDGDPESIARLKAALSRPNPNPPGESAPADFYDVVTEEWKMYTYFNEYWREDATSIDID